MKETGQGVLQARRTTLLHSCIALLLAACLFTPVSANQPVELADSNDNSTVKHHIFAILSPDNSLHADIIQRLTDNIYNNHDDIIISRVRPGDRIKNINNKTDVIVAIGSEGMDSADSHYPKSKKLFISTNPNKYKLDKVRNKDDAILYMNQPYCRQIEFIKLLNQQWKTISILNSYEAPTYSKEIHRCAESLNLNTHLEDVNQEDNLTDKVKLSLRHSDVLLALPDNKIYNSRTVKNILLTSYRYRKPVIGFSKNFVTAGALAAIYSNTEKIAQSASTLLEQYFDSGMRFKTSTNYPDDFDISINKQVFHALSLPRPDIYRLKQTIKKSADSGAPK